MSESPVTLAAYKYTRKGWPVIPIHHGEKNPGNCYGEGWQQARLTEADLPTHFNGAPRNIGVLVGEPAGWLIDIDLDHARAVELAPSFMPVTDAVFGRKSKPRSHWLYRVTAPLPTKKWKSKSAGMIVEIRSTGGQTVFPPSTHPSGELIEWEVADAEPAVIDPEALYAAVEKLAETVLVELGEKKKKKPTKTKTAKASAPANNLERCVRAMLRMSIQDGGDGSHRLYAAACRCIEHDLADFEALTAIREYERQRPFPGEWTDEQILKRIEDAAKAPGVQRGAAFQKKKATISLDDPDVRIVTNATTEEYEDDEGETKSRMVPLAIGEIIEHMEKLTGNWPRRVGTALFCHDPKHGIAWLGSTASLFGWTNAQVDKLAWFTGIGCATKEETFHELRRVAPSHIAVENLPHEPYLKGHYYACEDIPPGDGAALEELLSRFRPSTPIDRDLMLAAFKTPLWGGHGGSRPCFVITSDAGRGAGKSALAQMIGHLYDGVLSFSHNEDINIIKQRLLSPEALLKRVGLLDNLKSLKFSWGELEALITAPEIGGKRMYHGEASRPNTLTWFITLNGASLSTDMAQRSVVIKVDKPPRSASWELDTIRFVRDHQKQLLADLIAVLRSPGIPLRRHTRWASWEDAVLSKLPDPAEAQAVIEERQGEVDVDAEECSIIEDYFSDQLRQLGYDVDADVIHIPNDTATRWFNWATNGSNRTTAVSRIINQLAGEGQLKRLRVDPCRSYGRGLQWMGARADLSRPQFVDVRQRVAQLMKDRRNEQPSETNW